MQLRSGRKMSKAEDKKKKKSKSKNQDDRVEKPKGSAGSPHASVSAASLLSLSGSSSTRTSLPSLRFAPEMPNILNALSSSIKRSGSLTPIAKSNAKANVEGPSSNVEPKEPAEQTPTNVPPSLVPRPRSASKKFLAALNRDRLFRQMSHDRKTPSPVHQRQEAQMQSLFRICISGDVSALDVLLEDNKTDTGNTSAEFVNNNFSAGGTPLYVATNNCHIDLAKRLVEVGHEVNRRNCQPSAAGADPQDHPRGDTALHAAIEKCLQAPSTSGPPSSALVSPRDTPQMMLDTLLEMKANPNMLDKNGQHPLCLLNDKSEDIKTSLLAQKADINALDENGETALHVAAEEDSLQIIERLIEKKANCMTLDKQGQTPLVVAARHGHSKILEKLLQALPPAEAVKALKRSQKPKSENMEDQWSVLQHTAYNHDVDSLRIVIAAKADVNESEQHPLALVHLREARRVLKQDTPDGGLVIRPTSDDAVSSTVDLLVKAKSCLNEGSLRLACAEHKPAMVLALVTAKADMHSKDTLGVTPLMTAASADTCDVVKVLLENLSLFDTENEDSTRAKIRSYASLADTRGWTAAHHSSEACLPTVIAAQVLGVCNPVL